MWKLLYRLASPKTFYQFTHFALMWLGYGAFLFLTVGGIWSLVFAPADYQQGEAFRIIYIHVPTAFLSLLLYAWMAFLAALFLIWHIKVAGLLLEIIAQVGASMAFLALVTGSIWGKPMWGTWWIWDARLTSELILFFLYCTVIAIKSTILQRDRGDKMAAIFILIGLVDLPIIHYSVYWWNTLHQGASLSLFAKPKIDSTMLYPLLLMLIGFLFYSFWLIFHRARDELLLREWRQQWVKKMMEEGAS